MNAQITVEPTADEQYIKSVFLNPIIYDQMRDDSCPILGEDLATARIMDVPGFFLRVLMGGLSVGCFWLIKKGSGYEAHTALLPPCRGRSAVVAARKAIQWVFEHTGASEITSYAWSDSPAVRWFCRAAGLSERDTRPWPNTRGGNPVDITYYGISREEVV